jgi:hypothetical protein
MIDIKDIVIQEIINSIKNMSEDDIKQLIKMVLSICENDIYLCKKIQTIIVAVNYAIDEYINHP